MAARGWDISKQLTVNLVFSLMCPLGAILFAIGVDQFVDFRDTILGIALAFSAGIFLCISLGDLLPEVHFHSHDRLKLSAMLLLGVAIAWAIEFLPGHNHGEKNSAVFASSGQQIISVESESEKRSESREGSGSSSLK
jgi:zinc and cadmium transporter